MSESPISYETKSFCFLRPSDESKWRLKFVLVCMQNRHLKVAYCQVHCMILCILKLNYFLDYQHRPTQFSILKCGRSAHSNLYMNKKYISIDLIDFKGKK